jgi:hypothetical protein
VTHTLLVGSAPTEQLGNWLWRHSDKVAEVGDYRMYKLRASSRAAYKPVLPEPENLPVQEKL